MCPRTVISLILALYLKTEQSIRIEIRFIHISREYGMPNLIALAIIFTELLEVYSRLFMNSDFVAHFPRDPFCTKDLVYVK